MTDRTDTESRRTTTAVQPDAGRLNALALAGGKADPVVCDRGHVVDARAPWVIPRPGRATVVLELPCFTCGTAQLYEVEEAEAQARWSAVRGLAGGRLSGDLLAEGRP